MVMKSLLTLFVAACLFFLPVTAANAKYVSESLVFDGHGMDLRGVIESRRSVDRVYAATLVGGHRDKVDRPVKLGPAYELEFTFGVGDEDGARIERAHQFLYPFAEGGPVVHTPKGQSFDMSYGPVRFRRGYFAVPPRILHILHRAGLPDELPVTQSTRSALTRGDYKSSSPPWQLLIAGLIGAVLPLVRWVNRNSHRRQVL
jgi:hypothetical protein